MIRAALVAGAVVAALVEAGTPTPAPAAASTSSYVVTTQNVRYTLTTARARHDLAQAQRGSDLVLSQEMSGRRASRFELRGFRVVQPFDAPEVATFYRASVFRHDGTVPLLLHRSHLFGSATRYADGSIFTTRAAPHRCVIVANQHAIPHIDNGGHPRRLARLALAARGFARLAAFARLSRRGCALLVGGDWNVDGLADARIRAPVFPFAQLTRAGLRSEWVRFPHAAPTLGSRHVDGFYYAGIVPLARATIRGTYSDHNGDRLRFRIDR